VADDRVDEPESSAVRVALWRALHVQVDAAPHVLEDEIGLLLVSPDEGWRSRPDMDPEATAGFRASIVARARFIEDLVADAVDGGVAQYVILGAGLDTFAQRRPELASRLTVFEVDEPGPQAWKRRRLVELGFGVPDGLRFVPVDFESSRSWFDELPAGGFDRHRPAIVSSTGVSLYLTKEATAATLALLAGLAPGSTVAMTFILPPDLLDAAEGSALEETEQGARQAGTPFVSYYAPDEMLAMARDAGFAGATHVSGASLAERYFSGRDDGFGPSAGEDFLIATTPAGGPG
jgi:methyltransferase (TIGR00027 family)